MDKLVLGFLLGWFTSLPTYLYFEDKQPDIEPICSDNMTEVRQYQRDCLQQGNTVVIKAYCEGVEK